MNLTGNKIKNSYKALLTFPGATGMVSNPTDLKQMGDGGGNNTPLYLSTTQAGLQYTGQTANAAFAGFSLINNTAATSGNQQYSPAITQVGRGWTTTSAENKQIGFRTQVVPTSGTAGYLAIDSSVDGALATYVNSFRFKNNPVGTTPLVFGADLTLTEYTGIHTTSEYRIIFKPGSATFINTAQSIQFSDGYSAHSAITTGNQWIIGGTTASAKLHVVSTTEQLRLGYDVSNYVTHTVSSSGNLTIAPSGGALGLTGFMFLGNSITTGTEFYSFTTSKNTVNQSGTNLGFYNLGTTQSATGGAYSFTGSDWTHTSGTQLYVAISHVFAASGAGSSSYRPLNIVYTLNNTGAQSGTATGIFLNATETSLGTTPMTHNLMDLQVGEVSKFRVSNAGIVSATLQSGNAGLATGDWYYDTAAHILVNGDTIIGRKA